MYVYLHVLYGYFLIKCIDIETIQVNGNYTKHNFTLIHNLFSKQYLNEDIWDATPIFVKSNHNKFRK